MPRVSSTAIHEAGHAVVALCEQCTFSRVVLGGDGDVVGVTYDVVTRPGGEESVRIKLAGVMAERLCRRTWRHDLTRAAEGDLIGVGAFVRENDISDLVGWNIEATHETLVENWNAVEKIARALEGKKQLEYAEVHEIWSAASSMPAKAPPGQISDNIWAPLRARIDWHIANPGGVQAAIARALAS